jgi:hypothetical protein
MIAYLIFNTVAWFATLAAIAAGFWVGILLTPWTGQPAGWILEGCLAILAAVPVIKAWHRFHIRFDAL